MVPVSGAAAHYEFVILVFGKRRLRRSKFSPWQVNTGHL